MYQIDDHRVGILGGKGVYDSDEHFIYNAFLNKWIWIDTPQIEHSLSTSAGFVMDNSLYPSLCQSDVPFQPEMCMPQTSSKFVYTYGGIYNSKQSDSLFVFSIGKETQDDELNCPAGTGNALDAKNRPVCVRCQATT
jgi:hypothetical protein